MKKAMKKSKIAKGKRAKSSVFRGTKAKTGGGLSKADLKKNKTGKTVSRKASARAAARYSKNKKMQKWTACFKKSAKSSGDKGFLPLWRKHGEGQGLFGQDLLSLQAVKQKETFPRERTRHSPMAASFSAFENDCVGVCWGVRWRGKIHMVRMFFFSNGKHEYRVQVGSSICVQCIVKEMQTVYHSHYQ